MLLASGYEQLSMRMFQRRQVGAAALPPLYRCQEDGMVGLGCGARSYTRRLHYSWPYAVGRDQVRGIVGDFLAAGAERFAQAAHGMVLDDEDQKRRYVLLSLLQASGLDVAEYRCLFGTDPERELPQLRILSTQGLVEAQGRCLRLTPRGLERSDAIGPWLYSARVRQRMAE